MTGDAVRTLAEKIAQARTLGFLPAEWHELAQTALAEVGSAWLSERAFRLRTGASDKWCRQNFERYEAAGLARRTARKRREWHIHARLPRRGRDAESITRQIVESFEPQRDLVP